MSRFKAPTAIERRSPPQVPGHCRRSASEHSKIFPNRRDPPSSLRQDTICDVLSIDRRLPWRRHVVRGGSPDYRGFTCRAASAGAGRRSRPRDAVAHTACTSPSPEPPTPPRQSPPPATGASSWWTQLTAVAALLTASAALGALYLTGGSLWSPHQQHRRYRRRQAHRRRRHRRHAGTGRLCLQRADTRT